MSVLWKELDWKSAEILKRNDSAVRLKHPELYGKPRWFRKTQNGNYVSMYSSSSGSNHRISGAYDGYIFKGQPEWYLPELREALSPNGSEAGRE